MSYQYTKEIDLVHREKYFPEIWLILLQSTRRSEIMIKVLTINKNLSIGTYVLMLLLGSLLHTS